MKPIDRMDLRDRFADNALMSLINAKSDPVTVARLAYEYADAMLAERDKAALVANPPAAKPKTGKTKLVSLQEASAEYGPPYTSLRDMVIEGHLARVEMGDSRRIWVRREDLERLIYRQKATETAQEAQG